MTKFKTALAIIIAAMLVFFVSGGALFASAEETATEPPAQGTTESEVPETDTDGELTDGTETPATEPTEGAENTDDSSDNIENIAADFVAWLKENLGADYETYYNKIIENWGSIEAYLLQFGEENIPEEYQGGWENFVSIMGEYAWLWGSVLAVIVVIIVWFKGKKWLKKVITELVNKRVTGMETEINKQSKAQIATMRSVKALLGINEKFADSVKELEESEKELGS